MNRQIMVYIIIHVYYCTCQYTMLLYSMYTMCNNIYTGVQITSAIMCNNIYTGVQITSAIFLFIGLKIHQWMNSSLSMSCALFLV